MTDVALKFPALTSPMVVSDYPQYASFGMPKADGQLWSLRTLWLDSVMHTLTDTSGYERYFVKRVYENVEIWFAELVLRPGTRGSIDWEDNGALGQPLLNPVPYFKMFSTSLQ